MSCRFLSRAAGVALACAMSAGALSVGSGPAAGEPPREQSREISIRVVDGRVSAAFLNVPLVEAVTELAREAGFDLVIEGEIDRRVSLTRRDMEIDALLGELLQGCSWFSVFGPNDAVGRVRLSQVWLLRSPGCDGMAGGGATAAREPAVQLQPAPAALAAIDREDLAERQQYLLRVINGQARASVDELIDAVRDPPDPMIKMFSMMALGRAGGPEAQAALLEALTDEDPRVRAVGVRSLAQGWGEAAVAPLNSLLLRETEYQVIQAAVQQLGLIGTEAAWEALRRVADGDDPQVTAIADRTIRFFETLKQKSSQAQ